MCKFPKIEHREARWRLASRAPRDAGFREVKWHMWIASDSKIKIRKQGLKPSYNQHSMKQALVRLPVESRGWLAGELSLHTDKPSFIRLSTENGGGMNGLRRLQASMIRLRRVKSSASTDLTRRSVGHATTAPWRSLGDDRELDSHQKQLPVACR
jgi:hypothetical protein